MRPASGQLVHKGGYSLVEVIITAAIVALVFGTLFAAVQSMVQVIGNSKAKAGATALVNERLEYIRSLTYNQVGTVGAPPYGSIPQTRTVVLNEVTYYEQVVIRNIDDAADGTGYSDDSNGIIEDYKQVEVTYSWLYNGATSSVSLSSRIVPVGVETSVGGGSLRVNVFDADIQPVSNAAITIVNDTLATTTNTTQYTNVEGELLLSGLPAGANYSIWTTKAGYSADGTYEATTTNPNPTTQPIAISEGAVSTMNFQIDVLSDLEVRTYAQPTMGSFIDDFSSGANVAAFTDTQIVGTEVVLGDAGGGLYYSSGSVLSTTTSPGIIDRWYAFDFDATTNADTEVLVTLYYDDGSSLVPVPDSDLSGNTTGFSGGPIDLSGLDTTTYHTLALFGTLNTTDTLQTPALVDWELSYVVSQSAIASVPVDVRGDKVVGDDGGTTIYKFDDTFTSDGSGIVTLNDIEYDIYTITPDASYDVLEVCPIVPYSLLPNENTAITFALDSLSGAFVRVVVTDTAGDVIPAASVRLENSGYDVTQETSLCGQTYFNGGGLYTATDYTLTVSANGYVTEVLSDTEVSTDTTTVVILNAS